MPRFVRANAEWLSDSTPATFVDQSKVIFYNHSAVCRSGRQGPTAKGWGRAGARSRRCGDQEGLPQLQTRFGAIGGFPLGLGKAWRPDRPSPKMPISRLPRLSQTCPNRAKPPKSLRFAQAAGSRAAGGGVRETSGEGPARGTQPIAGPFLLSEDGRPKRWLSDARAHPRRCGSTEPTGTPSQARKCVRYGLREVRSYFHRMAQEWRRESMRCNPEEIDADQDAGEEGISKGRQGRQGERAAEAAAALARAGRGDRIGTSVTRRGGEQGVGLHQDAQPAEPREPPRDPGRRQAAQGVRQGQGNHVRDEQAPGAAPHVTASG
jgi:hypothetical protein